MPVNEPVASSVHLTLDEIKESIRQWRELAKKKDNHKELNNYLNEINPIRIKYDMFAKWRKHKPQYLNVYMGLLKRQTNAIVAVLVDSKSDRKGHLDENFIEVFDASELRQLPVLGDGMNIYEANGRIQTWKKLSLEWIYGAEDIFSVMLVPFEDLEQVFATNNAKEVYMHFALKTEGYDKHSPELIVLDAFAPKDGHFAMDVSTPVPPFPPDRILPEMHLLSTVL